MIDQPINNPAERSVLAAEISASSNISTERVREHRRRKREGMRLAHLEVRQQEIAFLKRQGWAPARRAPRALARALGRLLDLLMPELEAGTIVIRRKQ